MNIYEAKDRKYFTVGCAEPWLWEKLCEIVGRMDYVSDQYSPMDEQKEMYEEFSKVFSSKERDAWVMLLNDSDISSSPSYDFDDLFNDPHFQYHNIVVELDHPKVGKVKLLNTPFKFSETPADIRLRPPLCGEHSSEILRDLLGYSDEEIQRFRADGVIE